MQSGVPNVDCVFIFPTFVVLFLAVVEESDDILRIEFQVSFLHRLTRWQRVWLFFYTRLLHKGGSCSRRKYFCLICFKSKACFNFMVTSIFRFFSNVSFLKSGGGHHFTQIFNPVLKNQNISDHKHYRLGLSVVAGMFRNHSSLVSSFIFPFDLWYPKFYIDPEIDLPSLFDFTKRKSSVRPACCQSGRIK